MVERRYRAILLCLLLLLCACAPTPTGNVLGYMLAEQLGTLPTEPSQQPGGALTGVVLADGQPVADAAVLVAERTGQPHSAFTNERGEYRIENIPPGQYTPAAAAPGYAETVAATNLGIPRLVTIRAGETTVAPPLQLQPYQAEPLPAPFPEAVDLTLTATAIVTGAFPAGAEAEMQSFQFVRAGLVVDTLRLYRPLTVTAETSLPLLFMIYPTHVDLWQEVSTAFASQGFALVAISPLGARGTDIRSHAADAHVALELARTGLLDPQIAGDKVVALGGSFSSAILPQLIREAAGEITGWVTVGGISDALAGTADFYAGRLEIPPQYTYLIPALGLPNVYPLLFLRYSPVYSARELPATLIVHTAADHVIPISQAYALEAALRQVGTPVETFYYEDTSHYLQIDENMTDQGRAMFYRTVEFANKLLRAAP